MCAFQFAALSCSPWSQHAKDCRVAISIKLSLAQDAICSVLWAAYLQVMVLALLIFEAAIWQAMRAVRLTMSQLSSAQ